MQLAVGWFSGAKEESLVVCKVLEVGFGNLVISIFLQLNEVSKACLLNQLEGLCFCN